MPCKQSYSLLRSLLLVLAISLLSAVAHAGGCEDKEAIPFEPLVYKGASGSWLSTPVANRVYFLIAECMPKLKEQLVAERDLSSQALRLVTTTSSVAQAAAGTVAVERERADEYLEKLLDPLGGALPWFALGVALGVVATIGITYALTGATQ